MIVVLGESLIDRIIGAGGMTVERPGGAPFNVARGLTRLGSRARFVGPISRDPFGELLLQTLTDDDADLTGLLRSDDPTMVAVAELRDGVASYRFVVDGTAAVGLHAGDAAGLVPAGTPALYAGGIALGVEPIGGTIEQLIAGAGDETLVMIDPNIRPDAIPDPALLHARHDRILARTDILKVSVDDLAWIDPAGGDRAVDALLDRGARCIVLTDGPHGTTISTASGRISVPAVAAQVVDTVGAGDAYCAGLLSWWTGAGLGRRDLENPRALEQAARYAALVAALSCERVGAEPPTAGEVEAAAGRGGPVQAPS